MPTQTGWFADENIFAMDTADYSPARDARRVEAGTPSLPNIDAGVAGASIIEETGTEAIERHIESLAPRRSTDVDALVRALAQARIVGPHATTISG